MSSMNQNSYLRNSVLQASQEQLQLMLYDGAIRFALRGRDAIERKDHEASFEDLSRAQKIVLEMQAGLRPEVNAELCERMSSLYTFVYRKLVNGSVNRDPSEIDDALKILRMQRKTWVMLLEKVNQGRGEQDAVMGDESPNPGSLSVEG